MADERLVKVLRALYSRAVSAHPKSDHDHELIDICARAADEIERLQALANQYAQEASSNALKLDKQLEEYDYVVRHADRGWEFLKLAVSTLYAIAAPHEGPEVSSSFDEPVAAKLARAALNNLPSAGAYEGMPPWPIPKEPK